MEIVVAMDSLKECLTADRACRAVAEGLRASLPTAQVHEVPIGDGGEGTAEIIARQYGGVWIPAETVGPRFSSMKSGFFEFEGPDGKEIAIDVASASGLALLPDEARDAHLTSTYGTGLLLRRALERSPRVITLCLGGSATVDCGIGILGALGAEILDENGIFGPHELIGGRLKDVKEIRLDGAKRLLGDVLLRVVCDVETPMLSADAHVADMTEVFGPQKGIFLDEIGVFRTGVANFVNVLTAACSIDISELPGSGTAGGIAGTLHAAFDAELLRGADLIASLPAVQRYIPGADLIITGEGMSDRQTLMGKAPSAVLSAARVHRVPVVLMSGRIEDAVSLREAGFTDVVNINAESDPALDPLDPEIASARLKHFANIFAQKLFLFGK